MVKLVKNKFTMHIIQYLIQHYVIMIINIKHKVVSTAHLLIDLNNIKKKTNTNCIK